MPLRLVNKQRTHTIEACGTRFTIRSLSIGDKEKLVYDLMTIGDGTSAEDSAFSRLVDRLCTAIVSIEGYEEPPADILKQLEELEDLRAIVQAVIAFCSLTKAERKNSPSSSVQPTPESAGNVEKPAGPDGEPASTTQTQLDL
jgi:hypothetical protein